MLTYARVRKFKKKKMRLLARSDKQVEPTNTQARIWTQVKLTFQV